ncbi:hypothetical protein E3J61_01450 [Candidatus Dependentiae bacterium]|nr:MAG: hypothetical protein E3J61_01450 [Candidatus Dependentiae bacterium]
MKNRKTRFIVSLALCLGVAIPAYAHEPKEAPQSEVSKALGTAQKVIQATKYGVFVLGGAAAFVGSSYGLIYRPARKLRRMVGPDEVGENEGKIFAGGVADLVGLALMSYGIRGWKRMADGIDKVEKDDTEKQIEKIIDTTQKGARFGARLAGYGLLTGFGIAVTMIGVAMSKQLVDGDAESSYRSNLENSWDGKPKRVIASGFSFGIGIPAIALGISGLIRTCKRKKQKKLVDTREIAVQTDDDLS